MTNNMLMVIVAIIQDNKTEGVKKKKRKIGSEDVLTD